MTADTREQEMEAHRAWIQPVFKDGLRKWDEWRDLNQVDAAEPVTKAAFLAGHAVVHAELRPLIEAARAYRDAIAEIRALPDWPLEMKAKYMIAVNEADHALHEAARTLEGHVEEGSAQ
jgi:hypothetical protein